MTLIQALAVRRFRTTGLTLWQASFTGGITSTFDPKADNWRSHTRGPVRVNCRPAAALRAMSGNGTFQTGRNVMEWFSQKTSIAGTQIPNWALVLGAVIVIWIIYRFVL